MIGSKQRTHFLLCFLLGLSICIGFACTPEVDGQVPPNASAQAGMSNANAVTETYGTLNQRSDIENHFKSLDIYPLAEPTTTATNAPVVLYVHGGGFRRGDKSRVDNKPEAFNEAGYVFVSANYRLSSDTSHNFAARHPAHVEDVAEAIAWVHENIADWGGDPEQIFLLGHSSGAHLVSLVATDPQYLEAHGLALSLLDGVMAIDTNLFNLVEQVNNRRQLARLINNAFGENLAIIRNASPLTHVAAGKGIPPFLLTYTRTNAQRTNQQFANSLTDAGVPVTLIDNTGESHASVNRNIGLPDYALTDEIFSFLDQYSQPSAVAAPSSEAATTSNAATTAANSENIQNFQLSFTKDYFPGTNDANGQFMGGTENNHLIVHDGKLWAGMGYWRDEPGNDPSPGAQVLVKASAASDWAVDNSWGPGYVRVDAMDSVQLTTDITGTPLPEPKSLLLASVSEAEGDRETTVWSRESERGTWTKTVVSSDSLASDGKEKPYVRVLADHVDQVTGVHYVFAGAAKGAIYKGAYDIESGGLVWEKDPEFFPGQNRIHAMEIANNKLYATVGRDNESDVGGLYQRVDGTSPSWELIYRWPTINRRRYKGGMRGLTAVSVAGYEQELLLGAREHPGVIELIDPTQPNQVVKDFDYRSYFEQLWGGLGGAASIAAYNTITPVVNPNTGNTVHLIGLWINHPDLKTRQTEVGSSSWYLVRSSNGDYGYGRVFDPEHPIPDAPDGLRATRSIVVSPFPEDQAEVLYFGGYDAGGAGQKHNTAWIYRATLN
ncbi:MAG: alpha/beta hydrolase [Phormidesmis sp.]